MEKILAEIVISLDRYCESLMKKSDDNIFEVKINYFDDGEFVDLGTRIVVCDKNMEDFRDGYLSFTVHDEKLKPMILKYLETFEERKRYSQLKKLARETKKAIKEKGKYISKKLFCQLNPMINERVKFFYKEVVRLLQTTSPHN